MVHGSKFRKLFRKFQIFAGPTATVIIPQNLSLHSKDSAAGGTYRLWTSNSGVSSGNPGSAGFALQLLE